MTDEWFFAWDEREFGPFSAEQLKTLAAIGRLQPTDVVWTPGMSARVPAARVKNLFAMPNGRGGDTEVHAAPTPPNEPEEAPPAPAEKAPPPASPQPAPAVRPPFVPHKKKGRATAGPGVVIVSQDGERVQYRKKCIKCGYEDAMRHSMAIRNGVTRAPFFCPKCKKTHLVEIQCMLH